ncbi:MAG: MlaD family protein [Paludibacter sp.]|nr:MlaD family protein [Paludibacter sp.]
MKKIKITREVRVGLMTVTAIFILYFGLNFLKGIDIFSPINYYYGVYENIDGLVPSSPVYIKGYKVGQVEEVQYDFTQTTPFVVKISVSKDIVLPKGAIVELFDDGLMGGKAIQLVYPLAGQSNNLYVSGDTLQTRVGSGLMDQLAGDMVPKIESIATQADSLLRSVRLLVDGGSVQNSLSSIEKTTADLAISSSALKKMLQKDMPGIISDVNTVTGDFKVISGNLRKIDFASTFNDVDLTIKDLNHITGQIKNSEGSLGLLVNDKSLYLNLSNTAGSADKLLIDLQKNPKRYVHFSLFGSKEK